LRSLKIRNGKKSVLKVLNEMLAEYGGKIITERTLFLSKLAGSAKDYHLYISNSTEQLSVKYEPSVAPGDSAKENLLKIYEKYMEREIEREYCLYGPHRDEILFLLNDVDLRRFGSQGQKRTAVLAVKIAELFIMKTLTGRTPVFLMDDVMSELDHGRQELLLETIKGIQVFITAVEKIKIKEKNSNYFLINEGKLSNI
jgi:DNA replication and repair protein RecF